MKKEAGGNYINGAVRILSGQYQDTILKLQPGEKLVVGRDVNTCHLVLEAPWISRYHCTISFDFEKKEYIVVDYSGNGTFIKDGKRLIKEIPQCFESGTVITIGENGIALQLM